MKDWLIEKWDWWIYHRAFKSMARMCARNHGFAYLLELHIREYRKKHPISPALERATETFYESMTKDAA